MKTSKDKATAQLLQATSFTTSLSSWGKSFSLHSFQICLLPTYAHNLSSSNYTLLWRACLHLLDELFIGTEELLLCHLRFVSSPVKVSPGPSGFPTTGSATAPTIPAALCWSCPSMYQLLSCTGGALRSNTTVTFVFICFHRTIEQL